MKLNAKQLAGLPDSDFGLPKERKYPMPDKEHVRKAIQFFKYCPAGKEKELASNINRKAKEYGMKLNVKGAFAKYVSPEVMSVSKEASNVGTLEPIVASIEKPVLSKMKIPDMNDNADIGLKFLGGIANESIIHKITNRKTGIAESTFELSDKSKGLIDQLKRNGSVVTVHRGVFKDFEDLVLRASIRCEYNLMMKYMTSGRDSYSKITLPAHLREVEINSRDYIVSVYDDEFIPIITKVEMISGLLHTIKDKELLFGLLSSLYYLDKDNLVIFKEVISKLVTRKNNAISTLPLLNFTNIDLSRVNTFDGMSINNPSYNFSNKDVESVECMSTILNNGSLIVPIIKYFKNMIEHKGFIITKEYPLLMELNGKIILERFNNFVGYYVVSEKDKGELFLKRIDGTILPTIFVNRKELNNFGFIVYYVEQKHVNEFSKNILHLSEYGDIEVFKYIESHIRYDYYELCGDSISTRQITREGFFDNVFKSNTDNDKLRGEIVTDKNERLKAFKQAQLLVENIIRSFDMKFQKSTSKNKYQDYIKDFVEMKYHYVVLFWYDMRNFPDKRDRQLVLSEYEDKYISKFFKELDKIKNKIPGFLIEYTEDNSYEGFVQLIDINSTASEAYTVYNESADLSKNDIEAIKNLRVTADGDVMLNINDKITFEHYKEIHNVIIADINSGNEDAIRSDLAYLFSLICVIETEYTFNKEIDKRSDKYLQVVKLRSLFVKDFKDGLRKIRSINNKFNFLEYYKSAGFESSVYTIDNKTIRSIGVIFSNLMIN